MQPSFDDALRSDGLVLVLCAQCAHDGFILCSDGWRCGKCNEWAQAAGVGWSNRRYANVDSRPNDECRAGRRLLRPRRSPRVFLQNPRAR